MEEGSGGAVGAATAINGLTGETASEKVNSAWRGQFRSVAEARGRNARVAEAMVSERIEIPGLSSSTELVTLTAAQALEYDIADLQAGSVQDALSQLGYGDVALQTVAPSPWERVTGALSNPLWAALLLAVGVIGITVEVFAPGFGLPGIVGVARLDHAITCVRERVGTDHANEQLILDEEDGGAACLTHKSDLPC